MPFFEGASDFNINQGQFTDASRTYETTTVHGIMNSGIMAGVAQGGGTVTAGSIQVTRGIETVKQQPSNVIPSDPQETNRNSTVIGVNEASIQLLRALATAILHLQVPAQTLLEALGEPNANQVPNSAAQQHPSAATTAGHLNAGTAAAVFSSAVTGLTAMVQPNLQAASVSAPSIPHTMTSSPAPPSPNYPEKRSTASGEGGQQRRSVLQMFSKRQNL